MESTQKTLVIDLNSEPENQRLLAGEPGTCGMRSGRVYLAPGKACGQHSTKNLEELLVFLSGSGEVLIGEDECFQVGQGKVCCIRLLRCPRSRRVEPIAASIRNAALSADLPDSRGGQGLTPYKDR